MYFIGYDIGSSSIKVALVNTTTGKSVGVHKEPPVEMSILAPKKGWAEQNPSDWWDHLCKATRVLLSQYSIQNKDIKGIGISYQMHGLVVIDKKGIVVRNAIIWCDSRAVKIGEQAYKDLGAENCATHLLNSPANFTASKLKWVKENEPDIYKRIYKAMLPGDYIAYKLSDAVTTSTPGLSEGTFWDFQEQKISQWLLDYYEIDNKLLPDLVPTFGVQGVVSKTAALQSGLAAGTPILYRAGDQPNNALSLNIFNPGEVAMTCGTSGVVYAITNTISTKEHTRINNFAHVNFLSSCPRIGKLLCINGAGIQYRWLLHNLDVSSYEEMNELAASVPIGSDGVLLLPFGNGAERMLNNRTIGTQLFNINLNRHTKSHLCRAAIEGIAFAFVYGLEIMMSDGLIPSVIRAGNDNLFQSKIFSITIASLIDKEIEIYNTTGAIGAARACALHKGNFDSFGEFTTNDYITTYTPADTTVDYKAAYKCWKKKLELQLKNC
jgi:xylulokinase